MVANAPGTTDATENTIQITVNTALLAGDNRTVTRYGISNPGACMPRSSIQWCAAF